MIFICKVCNLLILKFDIFNLYTFGYLKIYNLVFMGTIHFASPASSKIGTWYCHVSSVILTLEMWRVSVLTTSVAVYRYIFIIYREKAKCSKKREKRVIWVILADFGILFLFQSSCSIEK